jgi:allantoicase
VFSPHTFGTKGQVYDGWETRRSRTPGHDWAVVRLGTPGVVRGIVVDTAFFTGNYPPFASVEGCAARGYPSPTELGELPWDVLVARSPLAGDRQHRFPVRAEHRYTHVRLNIYPDGGVARLRVHGEPVPDPALLDLGWLDLAALDNGARIAGCSNMFYSSPANLISPGLAAVMGDGWETARRREGANDWVTVALAGPGVVSLAELDTSHFKGNAPGGAALSGCDTRTSALDDAAGWFELLPRTRLQPDTRHRFRLAGTSPVTHVRLDVYPDGGMARLRLHGALTDDGRQAITRRYADLLPAHLRAGDS